MTRLILRINGVGILTNARKYAILLVHTNLYYGFPSDYTPENSVYKIIWIIGGKFNINIVIGCFCKIFGLRFRVNLLLISGLAR